jgi:hypothetical protein
VCVHFRFGAEQGFVPGKKKPNSSRGDEYHWFDYVATNVTGNAAAQFPFCNLSLPVADRGDCAGRLTLDNGTNVNRNNPQTTLVRAPDAAFNSTHGSTGIAVADGAAFLCETGEDVDECASHSSEFIGQGSIVDVNSDTQFPGQDVYIKIQMYGVNWRDVDGVVHLWQDLNGGWHDDVLGRCLDSDGPTPTEPDCFWASGSGNVATVEIWSDNNGKFGNF